MTDPMIQIILDQIKAEQCVLLIGPELLTQPGQPTSQERLVQSLNDQGFAIELDLDNFINLKNLKGLQKLKFETALKSYYDTLPVTDLHRKLAQIPFHLLLSTTPDRTWQNTFAELNFAHEFQFYNKLQNSPDLNQNPGKNCPLLYNLFGSIDNRYSLLCTYDDLFDFIFAIVGQESRLPKSLLETVRNASLFLFLGFDFERWYVKLLLRLLFKDHVDKPTPLTNEACIPDEQMRNFFVSNFQMEFIQLDVPTLVNGLYDQVKQEGLLRQPPTEEPLPQIDKRQRLTELTESYDLLSDKLSRLRKDKIIETDTAVKFKLENQIAETQAELAQIEKEIEALS